MHNPDQHYEAHILHLKDLYEQAEHNRMINALTQHRHARVRAAGRRMGVLLVTLGTWLARSAQRDEQPPDLVEQLVSCNGCNMKC
jgi:hypothetical protein